MARSIFKLFTARLNSQFKPKRALMTSPLSRIALLIDKTDIDSAAQALRDLRVGELTNNERRLALMLWWRIWSRWYKKNPTKFDQAKTWFKTLENARESGEIWPSISKAEEQAELLGASDATRTLALGIWGHLPTVDFGLQYATLTQGFLGGDLLLLEDLFAHLLRSDSDFVPDYWQYQTLARRWSELGGPRAETRFADLLERAGRTNLFDLFEIYRAMLRQTDVTSALKRASGLSDPTQRARLAGSLLGASQTNELIRSAVEAHEALSDDREERQFMQARLAIAHGRWDDAKRFTSGLLDHRELRNQSVCLRALALAHLGDYENAAAAIEHVRFGKSAPWFLRGRAAMIGMTRRLLEDGSLPVESLASPELLLGTGKPLAQSLWVGPSLRWIEQLSMKSYLLNGWRYKLFVYDEPEKVPEGVELCDASSILPRSAIFAEGDSSGAHKGSLGAFSDLFRYALLAKLGGMWTDTDVVNFRSFDPDGVRMVASEWTDAGLVGPNGAMMAAPAGDRLQSVALRRAEDLLQDSTLHFARIGPELLAELLGENGAGAYRLLPPHFLNPIGWMETGRLLEPFTKVRGLDILQHAHNLHVYTETWRTIGLDLLEPPQGDGFLPTVYSRLMEAKGQNPNQVKEIIAR